MGISGAPSHIYMCNFRAPRCRLDRVTSYVCDILIYLIMSDLRAQGWSQMVGKSRQGLPQPSSHGSAIPRRSSHFGDRGASLLGRRLRVRRLRKSQSAETLANLAFTNISSICLHTSKLQ